MTKAKRAKRNLLMALLEKSVLMRKQAIMSALHTQTRSKRDNRLNKQIAHTYRHDRIRRQSLAALRNYSVDSRRMKCLTGAAMFQRLVPKAFACLTMNMRVKKVKAEMRFRANQVFNERLLRKTLKGFVFNSINKKASNSKNREALTFARK